MDPKYLVARYLLENGYENTLLALQQESGYTLQPDQLDSEMTLDRLVHEYNDRQLALEAHKLEVAHMQLLDTWKSPSMRCCPQV